MSCPFGQIRATKPSDGAQMYCDPSDPAATAWHVAIPTAVYGPRELRFESLDLAHQVSQAIVLTWYGGDQAARREVRQVLGLAR